MKSVRHAVIKEIIESQDIETQEELAAALRARGIDVTQATVSRDIKELRLLKVLSDGGGYKYATADKAEHGLADRFIRIFSESVLSITPANNLIVIKTISGRRIIVDLKSCRSASLDDFRKAAINMGYDLQAAMYREGVKAETGEECDFVFVAVEKEPPYMINIIQCDELLLKRGSDLYREYLGMYKECSETDNWYGYNGAFGIINNMSLPSWLASQYEN
jgi:arginine repressor